MCLIAFFYRALDEYPLVLAANRDEFFDRQGTLPGRLTGGIVAGLDPVRGGTWLGAAGGGGAPTIAAVSNIGLGRPADPAARSRGLLCLDVLAAAPDESLAQALEENCRRHIYNDFNLLLARDGDVVLATQTGGRLKVRSLAANRGSKPVLIGNAPPPSQEPKLQRARRLIIRQDSIEKTIEALKLACGDHGDRPDRSDALCIHDHNRGTLSSTIIALHARDAGKHIYLHAQGAPCSTAYEDFSHLLRA
ncbi:MAG: NRDE family protein [Planctomycetaceae bacterium]|nr:NRDE family protein [Planctomycetaceae bacterium]